MRSFWQRRRVTRPLGGRGCCKTLLIICYCLVVLTELEFLVNSFSKDSLGDIAASAQAHRSCCISLQTKPAASLASNRESVMSIRPGKTRSAPPQGCCGAPLPSTAAAFPLHQGSLASFGSSLARSPQPLEAARGSLRESPHRFVQRKLSCLAHPHTRLRDRPCSFFPFPL